MPKKPPKIYSQRHRRKNGANHAGHGGGSDIRFIQGWCGQSTQLTSLIQRQTSYGAESHAESAFFLKKTQHPFPLITSAAECKTLYTGLSGSFRLERCTQDRTAPIAPALCHALCHALGHALGHAFRAAGRRSAGSAGSVGILSTGGAGTGMRASARLSVARKRACCRRRHSLGGAGGRGLPALASLTIGARCSW